MKSVYIYTWIVGGVGSNNNVGASGGTRRCLSSYSHFFYSEYTAVCDEQHACNVASGEKMRRKHGGPT